MRKMIVMNNSANVGGAAAKWNRGEYRHIALVLIDTDALPEGCEEPRMISERARGVIEILDSRYGIYVGTTSRSYGYRILRDYCLAAYDYNAERSRGGVADGE